MNAFSHLGLRFIASCFVSLALSASVAASPRLELSLLEPVDLRAWTARDLLAVQLELQHGGTVDESVSSAHVVLAPAGKAWPETVTLAVTGPDGRTLDWPFARSGTREKEPFTLTLGGLAAMSFILSPDEKRIVAPGRYTLRATIEIRDGTGWRGRSESAALTIEVAAAERAKVLELSTSVAGADALAPGDPWVFEIAIPPLSQHPGSDQLRSGYTITLQDASGRELDWKPERVVGRPGDFVWREIRDHGAGPILAVFPPEMTAGARPGPHTVRVGWASGESGPRGSAQAEFKVLARDVAEVSPARSAARTRQSLALATALLWQAERSSTAEIERLTTRTAAVLIDAEKTALDAYLAQPRSVEAAAAIAEVYFSQGDFDGARAFAHVALGLWEPPALAADLPEDASPLMPPEGLRALPREINERARQSPGRVLPYLRTALAAARGGNSPSPRSAPAASRPGTTPSPLPTVAGGAQWAVSARASSEYRATDYSAAQATGAPNVARHGDHARAWTPKLADGGEEWIELTFAQPVRATEVRVVQNFNPGAIVRIEVIDEAGKAAIVWTGPDKTAYAKNEIGTLVAKFPVTEKPIGRVKLVLNAKAVAGFNEIDAVQLVRGAP